MGVGATLHLVGRLGFSTDDKAVKRAGLDYWSDVDLHYHESLEDLRARYPDGRFFYVTKRTSRTYTSISYSEGDFLVFGKETEGLPEQFLEENPDSTVSIPINGKIRSLNLSNAVSIVSYELIRQLNFGSKE